MHPLRVAFLWHFHQPDYRSHNGFALPWVRLHAVKDYAWLPSLISSYPGLVHTFNVVPSLLDQLAAYGHGTTDMLQQEASRLIDEHLPAQPEAFSRALTVLNSSKAIEHPRHDALHRQALAGTWHTWTLQDWIDLTVWYHLAWCSPQLRIESDSVKGLLGKGSSYTTTDLLTLMQICVDACVDVVPTLRRLYHAGRIDLSVTPYHHPILPLLCNTDSTLEALPDTMLPSKSFAYPDDASKQISTALESATHAFDSNIRGMWPAEGSISNEAIRLFARHGVHWVASDEGVLENSLGDAYTPTSKFRAWSVGEHGETVSVLFRDRALSDSIGFTYSSWDADLAADDFIQRLEERRRLIVEQDGENALLDSVVSIILDGENCWEFYEGNGEPFLKALCTRLSDSTQYACIGMHEASRTTQALHRIVAGSWIGSSFDVWIGSPLKNLAWTLLREARVALASMPDSNAEDSVMRTNTSVWDDMFSAESSDWFWWYDERHNAPNKQDFDTLFRERLKTIFTACGVQPSVDLAISLYDHTADEGAEKGAVHISYGSVAMHSGDQIVRSIATETSDAWQRLSLRLERRPEGAEQVTLTLRSDAQPDRRARVNVDGLSWWSEQPEESMQWDGERTVVIYVQFRASWSVEVEEESNDGQHRSTTVVLNASLSVSGELGAQ